MSTPQTLLLAFLIGVVSGLRSLTAPAVVAWAARRNWINLHDSAVSFMGSSVAVVVFSVLALGELVADKLPWIPSRTTVVGIVPRLVFGGLSGAAIASGGTAVQRARCRAWRNRRDRRRVWRLLPSCAHRGDWKDSSVRRRLRGRRGRHRRGRSHRVEPLVVSSGRG